MSSNQARGRMYPVFSESTGLNPTDDRALTQVHGRPVWQAMEASAKGIRGHR